MSSINNVNSTSSNALRITGMATGMDTDSAIKQMMAGANAKLDKLNQNRKYTEWKQEAYRDIIKDFKALRDDYLLSSAGISTNMIRNANYSAATITTLGNDADAMSALALPGAAIGSSKVTVSQIAKSAKIVGGNIDAVNTNKKLSELGITDGSLNITVGSDAATVTVDSTKTIQDLINTIYNTKVGSSSETLYSKIKVSFSELTGSLTIETRSTGANQMLKISDTNNTILKGLELPGTITGEKLTDGTTADTTLGDLGMLLDQPLNFTVNGDVKSINLTTGQKISDVITAFDAQGITASFDSITQKFSISTKDGGNLSIDSNFDPLKLQQSGGATGQDSIVAITPSGSTIPTIVTKSSNSFTIDNITYNLIKDPGATAYDVNLTTKADGQQGVDKIKTFLEKYNALVEKINTKLKEKKNYNYSPLTDAQKEQMSDDDIKAWDSKAKEGILKNDSELQSILYSMRNAFTSAVKSAGLTLQEIGIDTYSNFEAISKPGQLKITDENKLKKALEERGDQVVKLFTVFEPSENEIIDALGTEASEEEKEKYKYNNTGILQRLEKIIYNIAGKSNGTLLEKAGYANTYSETTNMLTKQLKEQDKAISEMQKKIYTKQERYYQMFAKIESAMNELNAQQSWLMQSLGGK